ncbi:hypothetical protein ACFL24_02365 [Patescibacteria group bacterium]
MKWNTIFLVVLFISASTSMAIEFDHEWDELIGDLSWNVNGYQEGCGEIIGEYTFGTIRCVDLDGENFAQTGSIYIYPEDEGVDFEIEIGDESYSRNNLPAGGWSEVEFDVGTPPPAGSEVVLKFSDLQTSVRVDELMSGTFHESWDEEVPTGIKSTSLSEIKAVFK